MSETIFTDADRKAAEAINAEIVESLHKRTRTSGIWGIRTADEYVSGVIGCLDDQACSKMLFGDNGPALDRSSLIKAAESRLTYSNDEMVYDAPLTTTSKMQEYCKQQGVELPPRTLIIVENVVTSPKQDRDGDMLRTEGAIVDQNMPALWHHMLPMPVGKMIKVLKHTSKILKVSTAVIESSLGLDVAALIEFGALRISHGFLPYKYEPIERKSNGDGPMPGYDIKSFEILEESFVTVPSNTDAIITAYSRGKLCSPVAKHWAKHYFDGRSKTYQGIELPDTEIENKALTHNSNTADSEPSWGDVDKTKLPRLAFADMGEPDKKSTWGYPHHAVKDGGGMNEMGCFTTGTMYLHRGGLNAAWAAANGARSGQEASDAVKSHLQAHRKALGMDKEEESVGKSFDDNGSEVDTLENKTTEESVVVKQGRVLSKANEGRIREAANRTKQAAELLEETLKQVEQDAGETDSEKEPTLHESVLAVLWRIADATEEDMPMLAILREKLADRVGTLEKSKLRRQIDRILRTDR